MYAAALWLEHLCPVDVVVLCPDTKTAAAFAAPIPTGMNGCAFQARVLQPGRVPAYTDAAQMAANPPLAVLSVAYHGLDPAVANAFMTGLASLGSDRAVQYFEYGCAMSPREIREILEDLMSTTNWPVYSSIGKLHYGRGERDALFEVLQARGLTPSEEEVARINAPADLDQIKAWLRRSVTASQVSELFE
jgi:hypothetical protein